MCRSDPQIAVASTRIRTSPGPGRGTATVRTSVPAGPATAFVLTTAVMREGSFEPEAGSRPARFLGVFFRAVKSVSRLVVAHVARARAGGGGVARVDPDGPYPARDDLPRALDAQLLEEEREPPLERVADRFAGAGGEVPQLRLEGADRLLAGLVEELALGLALLFLAGHLLE